jgi:hypothetical protein
MAVVSRIGFPLSRVSTIASFSAFSSIRSAIFKSIADRSAGLVFFQDSKAFQAAFTAASTSSFPASATVARNSPFAGL